MKLVSKISGYLAHDMCMLMLCKVSHDHLVDGPRSPTNPADSFVVKRVQNRNWFLGDNNTYIYVCKQHQQRNTLQDKALRQLDYLDWFLNIDALRFCFFFPANCIVLQQRIINGDS